MARKACIETFGCQMNVHDSERMAGLLEQAGYELTTDLTDADVVIVNTCSVRERAEDRVFARLESAGWDRASRPLVAMTGCVAQQEGGRVFERTDTVDVVVGTQALQRLPSLLELASRTGARQVDINPYDDVSFPLGIARRQDPVKAYVTIIEGCNDYCAFCVVPYTRGHERMRPARQILDEVQQVAAEGRTEVNLLGQIVNHYQAPDLPGCDFARLLELIHDIDGIRRIRFASPHPRHVTPSMIRAMAELPKVCRHLHLPVQSGSTEILRAMRRRHTRDEYLALVDRVRGAIPDIALSTDMIVGFPGETERQFEDTLSLTRAVGYHSMFSFKYSQRPNTLAAAKLEDSVPEAEKSRRLTELQTLQREIQTDIHSRQVGRKVEVLIDSSSRKRDGEISGRTSGNTVVNFPGREDQVGTMTMVTIHRAGPNSLWGLSEDIHAD